MISSSVKKAFTQRKPVLISRENDNVYQILSIERLEGILQNPDALERTVFAKASDKTMKPPQTLDKSIVLKALEKSVSIKLEGIQKFDSKLEALRNEFYNQLGHPCDINCYLTPPFAQCFNPHFDDHDVFIIQIEGQKDWTVDHTAKEIYPLEAESFWQKSYEYHAPKNLILNKGEMLYIPAGHVHHAKTLKGFSLHLTIGVHQMKVIDLLHRMLEQQENENKRVFFNEPVSECKNSKAIFDELLDKVQRMSKKTISNYEKEWNREKMLEWAKQPSDQQIVALMKAMTYDTSACTGLLIKGVPHVKVEEKGDFIILKNSESRALVPIRYWKQFCKVYESSRWIPNDSIVAGENFMALNHHLQDLIVKGFIECKTTTP